jgi:hypothetical protein
VPNTQQLITTEISFFSGTVPTIPANPSPGITTVIPGTQFATYMCLTLTNPLGSGGNITVTVQRTPVAGGDTGIDTNASTAIGTLKPGDAPTLLEYAPYPGGILSLVCTAVVGAVTGVRIDAIGH